MKNTIRKALWIAGTICIASESLFSSFDDDCRLPGSITLPNPTVQCGGIRPAPVLCSQTSTCVDSSTQGSGGTPNLVCAAGGYSVSYDPLFTHLELNPPLSNNPLLGIHWSSNIRWCVVKTGCAVGCKDDFDGSSCCVSNVNDIVSKTSMLYWTKVLGPDGDPLSCLDIFQ